MAFPVEAFEGDTDYERLVLSSLSGVATDLPPPSTVYDVRGPSLGVTIGVGEAVGGASREQLLGLLRPLALGASYKTLDLLIEHALLGTSGPRRRLNFRDKMHLVQQRRPPNLPQLFNRRTALWDRFAALYVVFEEARHAVTH